MSAVAVIAKFEAKQNTETAMAEFFKSGLTILETQPATTGWFAYRTGPTSYGAFAVFASESDRESLLSSGGPKLSKEFAGLFMLPPSFEKADVLQARPPT